MDALTMILALSCPFGEDSLDQFPSLSRARDQQCRCQAHLDRLEALEKLYGWENGRWATWRDEVRETMAYWRLLEECLTEPSYPRREAMVRRMKERIGVKNFNEGWTPPEMPDDWRFRSDSDP